MVDVLCSKHSVQMNVWVRVPLSIQIRGYGGMVDPLVLEASVRKDVSVRVRLPVQKFKI